MDIHSSSSLDMISHMTYSLSDIVVCRHIKAHISEFHTQFFFYIAQLFYITHLWIYVIIRGGGIQIIFNYIIGREIYSM